MLNCLEGCTIWFVNVDAGLVVAAVHSCSAKYVPLGISLQTPYNTSGKLLLRYIYYQFLNIFKRIFSLFGVIEKEKQHQKEMYFLREAFFPKKLTYLESLL